MSLSLCSILAESALRYPDADAVVMGAERTSYSRLWEQARRYAAVLAEAGVGPGDKVGLLMPNVPDFPRAYYAALSLGAVVVPVHALLVSREITYVLQNAGCKLLIVGARPRWPPTWNATPTTRPSSSTPPAPPARPRVQS